MIVNCKYKQVLKWAGFLFKIGVTALLLVIIFTRVDLPALASVISRISIPVVLLVVLLYIISNFLMAIKWHMILDGYRFPAILRIVIIANFYIFIMPGQIAGEFSKIVKLGNTISEKQRIFISVGTDRISGFIGLLFLGMLGILLSIHCLPRYLLPSTAVLLCGFLLILIFINNKAVVNQFLRIMNSGVTILKRLISNGSSSPVIPITNDWKPIAVNRIFASVVVSVVYQASCILNLTVITWGLGLSVSYFDWCWIYMAVSILVLLPVTVAGIGLREGSFIWAMHLIGVPTEQALGVSVINLCLQIFGAAGGCLFEIFTKNTQDKQHNYCSSSDNIQ